MAPLAFPPQLQRPRLCNQHCRDSSPESALQDSYLLGCSASERRGVQQMLQLGVDGAEVGICPNALYEVIVAPFLLNHGSCLLGEHSDLLVAVLGREEVSASSPGA